ncbi:primosomal protein N' [Gorillibacterium timonense]|uniref:primosomal protein N' n=1 Tax=Gorillibacterium timonense TaxID=1689269 RepID=UPI00071DE2A7|nr:primosomal protein N' [Gorillibacterium timonense]
MYAKVVVDVAAKQTNRPFDYIVPPALEPWIEVGSRVGVPFGPRTVLGFVVELSVESEVDRKRLKAVDHVLDMYPPLTPELVELARWMSRTYLCHELTALQAMIPAALKAKYERQVTLSDSVSDNPWQLRVTGQDEIISFIQEKGSVSLDALLQRFPEESLWIREQIRTGVMEETQAIRNRMAKKKALTVFPPQDATSLAAYAEELPAQASRQKEVLLHLAKHPLPIRLTELMVQLNVGAGTVKSLADKGWLELREVEVLRDPYAGRHFARTSPLALTPEQQAVFEPIRQAVVRSRQEVFLLHGVTGSGKTEVYLQAIQQCLDLDKEAIVLVPEISLTPQMVERFKGRFGDEVAVLHSRLSTGERYDEWRKISMKLVRVVIGARSAVFAPFTRLGLIIIDEEHETSYKQEESPKYHAREVAVERARAHQATVVLGSATPSLESYYRALPVPPPGSTLAAKEAAAAGQSAIPGRMPQDSRLATPSAAYPGPPYRLLTMAERVENRPLPPVHIVDMRNELSEGNRSMFSRPLHKALGERLERGEQSVLLLNRRGYSTFVMCRTCGFTLQCPHCDISLTYHQSSRLVRCHYCGYTERQPEACPDCGSKHIRYFGTGTQKVEEELAKLYPGIRVIRMDVDTTTEKGSHEKWLTLFRKKQADVLLGTQMVAKGLDFPDVTLVGVIAADTVLGLPDFRAAERTFQLLTQVAGRAGRHQLPGEVFVQTYNPDHYSILRSAQHDYIGFVEEELAVRQVCGYPPYCGLILVTLSHTDIQKLVRAAEAFAHKLRDLAKLEGVYKDSSAPVPMDLFAGLPDGGGLPPEGEVEVLGPVASPIPRIKDRYRFRCMVKYRGSAAVSRLVDKAAAAFDEECAKDNLQISIDVDPLMLM